MRPRFPMSRSIPLCAFTLCSLCLCGSFVQAPAKITYTDHVLPILRDNCVACHNQDKSRGGLVVNNYTSLMQGGSSGEVVKPGDPDNSKMVQVVSHKVEPFMPPKSPMIPQASINTIRQWIQNGALETAGSKAATPSKPKVDI